MLQSSCNCPLESCFSKLKASVATGGALDSIHSNSESNLVSFMTLFGKGPAPNTLLGRCPIPECRQVAQMKNQVNGFNSVVSAALPALADLQKTLNSIISNKSSLCGPYSGVTDTLQTALDSISPYLSSAQGVVSAIHSKLSSCSDDAGCGTPPNVSFCINSITPLAQHITGVHTAISQAVSIYYSFCTTAQNSLKDNSKCPFSDVFDKWRTFITPPASGQDSPIIATGKELMNISYQIPKVMQNQCCSYCDMEPPRSGCSSDTKPVEVKKTSESAHPPPPPSNCPPGTCALKADVSSLSGSFSKIQSEYKNYFSAVDSGLKEITQNIAEFPYEDVKAILPNLETATKNAETSLDSVDGIFTSSTYFVDAYNKSKNSIAPFHTFMKVLYRVMSLYDADCKKSLGKREPF